MFTLSTYNVKIICEIICKKESSSMTKDNYHHGDLKAELIREGLKILDREGYEAFSLRNVAKACNVSQTAPYRHFKDKDELVSAIADQALKAFNDCLVAAVEKFPDDSKKQLKEMGVAYVDFFIRNPEYLRLLFFTDMSLKNKYEASKPADHSMENHPYMTLYHAVERYKKQYPEEQMSQNELVLYCWGLVHGISVLINSNDFPMGESGMDIVRNILEGEKFLT